MHTEDDATYFLRRAQQERLKAEQATDPVSYKLHLEMAREYERRWGSGPEVEASENAQAG